MEYNDTQIKCLIEELVFLLQNNNELEWAATFKNLLDELSKSEDKKKLAKKIVDLYKGDMGSFADLALQKDMKMLVEENNALAKLKHELFNLCIHYYEQKKVKKIKCSPNGEVAPQGNIFLGGTQQIFIEKPWLIPNVTVVDKFTIQQELLWNLKARR